MHKKNKPNNPVFGLFWIYFKRSKIAIPKNNSKTPTTIKIILKILEKPKSSSGKLVVEVTVGLEEEVFVVDLVVFVVELVAELAGELLVEFVALSKLFVLLVVLVAVFVVLKLRVKASGSISVA